MSDEGRVVVEACRVEEILARRIRKSMYVSLRSVSCQFDDGLLTLRGVVPSFYIKQVVLSLLDDLEREGINRINDEIRVAD